MTVPLGIESFQRACPAVPAGVVTVICGATPVRCSMFDGFLADDRAHLLLRTAGGFVTALGGVVSHFGGVVAAVSRTVPAVALLAVMRASRSRSW
jgi:hypothetical protein